MPAAPAAFDVERPTRRGFRPDALRAAERKHAIATAAAHAA